MTILGLNAYHGDSSACLVRDGIIVAAAEEERFRRVKHWAGLPVRAIEFCLQQSSLSICDLDHIAVNRKPGVNNLRRLAFVVAHRPDVGLIFNRVKNIRKAAGLEIALQEAFPGKTIKARVHHIEHHLAHLASAFLVSEFDEAVCVSVDGFGDFASAAWGMGRGHNIQIDDRIFFPHSLGIFYSALTQYLGFRHFGDEYKVMGLAPYGEPKFLAPMRQVGGVQKNGSFRLALKFFRHHRENVSYSWNDCAPEVGLLYSSHLEQLLGPARNPDQPLEQRHKDIARSVQSMYEEAFFALLNALHAKYRCPNLALAGGCAMNSVANGKIYLNTPFRKLYLPAAAGDAGGAIGAAMIVNAGASTNSHQLPTRRPAVIDAYHGPEFSAREIATLLQSRGLLEAAGATSVSSDAGLRVEKIADETELCSRTAAGIAAGKVVGWFQGRMEWGPRALGNRSILGDPRRADMKDILNAKIKRRESFRPFAPSILREWVSEWFEQDDDVPFMMQVFQVRAEKRALVPATTHVDGSGRLQTVHRDTNPLYHSLIQRFNGLTGVPMVLNTSFNENEPVVCRPEEALDCFLRTKMDVLVLGSFFVRRKS